MPLSVKANSLPSLPPSARLGHANLVLPSVPLFCQDNSVAFMIKDGYILQDNNDLSLRMTLRHAQCYLGNSCGTFVVMKNLATKDVSEQPEGARGGVWKTGGNLTQHVEYLNISER